MTEINVLPLRPPVPGISQEHIAAALAAGLAPGQSLVLDAGDGRYEHVVECLARAAPSVGYFCTQNWYMPMNVSGFSRSNVSQRLRSIMPSSAGNLARYCLRVAARRSKPKKFKSWSARNAPISDSVWQCS